MPLLQVDYRGGGAITTSGPESILEQFTTPTPNGDTDPPGSGQGPENRFNLDNGFVLFTPNAAGGYNVRTILAPPPAGTGTVTSASGSAPAAAAAFGPALAASTLTSTSQTSASAQTPPPIWTNAEVIVSSSSQTAYVGMTNTDSAGNFVLNGVPPGSISVSIRRNGQVIAQGSGIFAGGTLTSSQLLQIPIVPIAASTPNKTPGR